MPESIPYQCFVSYRHIDDEEYDGVVKRLKREVAGRFEAETGTKLEIFLDRDSIGWGEQWREKISDAITSSTLFMPIITMRYFNSDNCRDEFSAFHSAAEQRGVTDLILPVILAGSVHMTSERDDELANIVSKLNWKSISDEFNAGYDSSDWKRRVSEIVRDLQKALERAAERLTNQESVAPSRIGSPEAEAEVEVDAQAIEQHIEELAAELGDLEPIMVQVAAVANNRLTGRDLSQMTSAQRATLFSALAEDLRQPAREFGAKASNLEAIARQTDAEVRAFAAEFYDINPDLAQEQLDQLHGTIESSFAGAEETFAALDQLEKSMRVAAMASVKLRRSISPMTTGLRSLATALNIVRSWQTIDPSATRA